MTDALSRGDVILVRFPNTDQLTYKLRPALIVQSDDFRSEYGDWIVVMITSRLGRRSDTTVEVTSSSPAGAAMGLMLDSLIVANRVSTIEAESVEEKIGSCPRMNEVDVALRKVFGL
jgi:mRNA-degrading endonuclease toxin of MazEF toxin-antitoxin module